LKKHGSTSELKKQKQWYKKEQEKINIILKIKDPDTEVVRSIKYFGTVNRNIRN